MNKNERLFKISTLLIISGFLLIIGNGWIGNLLADIWLNMQSGIVDNTVYPFLKYTYSSSFLSLGNILFGVGLLALLFSWYKKQEG